MDLSKFKTKSDTVVVELMDPVDDEPIKNPDGSPMSVTVYGSHAKEFRKVQDEMSDEQMAKRFKSKKNKSGPAIPSISEIRKQSIELAARTTIEWNLTLDKKPVEFSVDRALSLYEEFPFIFDQVQEKANDYEAFLGNS